MPESTQRAVLLAGGAMYVVPTVEASDIVIAADSGYDHAVANGIPVAVLVGDLDSISDAGLAHAKRMSIEIEQHSSDKDKTDLELAMRVALRRSVASIEIYGGEGGRIGHLLGVALLLTSREWMQLPVTWHTATGTVQAATNFKPVRLESHVGQTITLLPIGDVAGVTTTGMKWPLQDAELHGGTSLGISNEATDRQVTVRVTDGTLLVIAEGSHQT